MGRGNVSVAGAAADLVLFDPNREVTIAAEALHQNCDYTPYEGMRVKGWPQTVLSRGEAIFRDGQFVDPAGVGDGATVIDLDGSQTILPGFIDLHAHYNFDLVDNGRAEEVVYNGIVFLANGVTSTWSVIFSAPARMSAARSICAGSPAPR